jgi:hypothetical protein
MAQSGILVQYAKDTVKDFKKLFAVTSEIGFRNVVDMAFIYADLSAGGLRSNTFEG